MRPTTEGATIDHRTPVCLGELAARKRAGVPVVMVTAYDYPSAQAVQHSDAVDLVLVGDTGAEMMLGYRGTVPVSLEEMLTMTRAVRRGLRTPLLVGDLPLGSYESSDLQAVVTAQRLVKEGGADVVKLERAGSSISRAKAIVDAGIPVIGHLGLTPQTETALGGRRAQGRSAAQAIQLISDALALQEAGCCAIVLEAVPSPVATAVTDRLAVPTIGIGAGAGTDGQVLVWHDLLGLYDWRPRFAKAFTELRPTITDAIRRFGEEVRSLQFPGPEQGYRIDEDQLQEFLDAIGSRPTGAD